MRPEAAQSCRETYGLGRRCFELFLSATVALGIVTILSFSNVRWWSREVTSWAWQLDQLVYRGHRGMFGQFAVYFVAAGVGMGAIFAFVHLLLARGILRRKLRIPVGIVAVAVPPVVWWWVRQTRPQFFLNLDHSLSFVLEPAIAVLCALLYAHRRWPISTWTSSILLTLHAAFWARAYAITIAFAYPQLLAIPIVGFLSVLAWADYVTDSVGVQSAIN